MADNKALADRLEAARNNAAEMAKQAPDEWCDPLTELRDDLTKCIEAAAALPATPSAQAGEVIGEVRENGVTWFGPNPHAHPVGTKFYTTPQPQGDASPEPTDEAVAEFRRFLNAQKPVDGKITTRQARHILRAWPAATPQARPDADQVMKAALFACIAEGRTNGRYGGVMYQGGFASVTFNVEPAAQARPDECPACHKAWGEHRSGYSASRCQMKPAPTVDGGNKWLTMPMFDHSPVPDDYRGQATGYRAGWNDALQTRPAPAPDVARLVSGLRQLRTDYVRLLETGRDRIRDLGGDCDPVDAMEKSDPALREVDDLLAPFTAAQQKGATNGQE